MPLYRFQLLDRFFQINSERNEVDKSIKKVLPLLKLFTEFDFIYTPSSKLCIDETIAPFLGKFKYLTYNPQKPTKWGIRIISMADAYTGFCLSLMPYLGQETYKFHDVKTLNDLVINQMKRFGSQNSSLYIDSYYCNFTLAEKLLQEGFNVTGTFRQDRKDVPLNIKNAQVKKMVSGKKKAVQPTGVISKDVKYFQSNKGVFALKWKAKKEITLLTTNHSMEFSVKETARNREVNRPNAVHEYIKFMRGIDRLNKKIHYIR